MSSGQEHGERLERQGSSDVPPFAARQINSNVQVRLWQGGPMIDLGATSAELLDASLGAISELAKKAPGYLLSPILAKATDRIRAARKERGKSS